MEILNQDKTEGLISNEVMLHFFSTGRHAPKSIGTGIQLGGSSDELRLLELLSRFIVKTDNKPSISNELQILI